MRKSYKAFSYKNFLEDLREEIRFSKYTQESIALYHLDMARETLNRIQLAYNSQDANRYILQAICK